MDEHDRGADREHVCRRIHLRFHQPFLLVAFLYEAFRPNSMTLAGYPSSVMTSLFHWQHAKVRIEFGDLAELHLDDIRLIAAHLALSLPEKR